MNFNLLRPVVFVWIDHIERSIWEQIGHVARSATLTTNITTSDGPANNAPS